jgi:multidrug efflux system outer membrane protein
MNKRTFLMSVVLTSALAGCAVGPDFEPPDMSTHIPAHFARAEADVARGSMTSGNDGFWRSFNDPNLNGLVEQALAANRDLSVALANYDRDHALLREARFNRYPTITASGGVAHERVSQDQAYGFPRSNDIYSASINASWELDLWGRVRRDIEAHRAETEARAADVYALQVSIAGEVADAYVHLRGTQERLRVARSNAENQRETLRIVNVRSNAGRDADFDTARARAQFELTVSRVPVLEAEIAVDEHRLAVLTGRAPEALIDDLDAPGPLPALPGPIDPDTPPDVLRRRPDVAAAEQRLHAATARVGVATADLFPRLTLEGMLGSYAFGGMFTSRSETNLVALGIDWSFLDVGRVRARIAASNADAAGLLAQYQQTVLLALEDTENALIRYANTRTEDQHLERAAFDSMRAAQLARTQFHAGTIGLYEVLDAERVQLQAQDAFTDGRTRAAVSAIALYKALAGGWPQYTAMRE